MRIAIIYTVLFITNFICLKVQAQDTLKLKVVHVRDGDTIVAVTDMNRKIVIRFHGIDSPDNCQRYYQEAKEFVANRLLNTTIMYVETGIDRFERSVGEILVEPDNMKGSYTVWFNQVLVGAGYAWHWPRYSKSEKLRLAQVTAEKFKVGLWQDKNPIPPWEFRKTDEYKRCNSKT